MDKTYNIVLEKLTDIHNCTGLDLNDLKHLYLAKHAKYYCRALETNSTLDFDKFSKRALAVIQLYATKKYGYRESWIE